MRDQLVDELLASHPMLGEIVDRSLAQVVHTEATGEKLRRHCPGANVVTVPMGVGDPYVGVPGVQQRKARTNEGIPEGWFVAAMFGVVHPLKRPEVFLAACAEVVRQHPPTVVLVVGPGFEAEYVDELRAFAERLGIAAHVRFTGHVPRPRFDDLMVACDAVVNLRGRWTSHQSAIAMRAAAAAKPVLVSDVADWRDLPAEPFLRVPAGDEEVPVLAAHLLRLATDPAERQRLSRLARGWFGRAATVEAMAAGYSSVIDNVLSPVPA